MCTSGSSSSSWDSQGKNPASTLRPYSGAETDACIPALCAGYAQRIFPNLIQLRVPLLGDGATHNGLANSS